METVRLVEKQLLEGLGRIRLHEETWLMHTYTALQWHEISRHMPVNLHWWE